MSSPRLRLRSLMVAVPAIAGMFWAAGGASACETRAMKRATRACCIAVTSPRCGCCDAVPIDSPPAPPAAEEATSNSPAAATLGSQAESCQCRVEGPAPPGERRPEPPAEERPERERAEILRVLPREGSPRASALGRDSGRAGVSAKVPLYLRTSRFLI